MLAVTDGDAAIEFYKAAFGATVLWPVSADYKGVTEKGCEASDPCVFTEKKDHVISVIREIAPV
jgi:uncharacterized glyoxalase superfamily protein PhnB